MCLNKASIKILIQIFYREIHEFNCKVIGLDLKRNEDPAILRTSEVHLVKCVPSGIIENFKNKQTMVDHRQIWGTTQIGLAFIGKGGNCGG